jgi:hypothetical protein
MNRRRLAVAALVAAVTLGGCGMPGQTRVQDNGAGLSGGETSGSDTVSSPPQRIASREPGQFVRNFLSAPAGDLDGADERQREYLTRDGQSWAPSKNIQVVELTEKPSVDVARGTVRLRNLRHIGSLNEDGTLTPPDEQVPKDYTFRVGHGENENNGLFLLNPPDGLMLMSLDALQEFYEPRVLYFWAKDRSGLVPDARYMPRSVAPAGRPNIVVGWLIAGPSGWLASTVEPLRNGTDKRGNVPAPAEGRLVVNLNAAAVGDKEQLDRLGSQLRWSLRSDWDGDVELRTDNQTRRVFDGDAYVGDNPESGREAPQSFCVFLGRVYRCRVAGGENEPADVPLPARINGSVRSAAFARSAQYQIMGAVVRESADGGLDLWVGEGSAYKRTRGSYGQMSRPMWVAYTGATGLIVADGSLYRFRRGGEKLEPVALAGAGDVEAVATPSDGRRLAYVRDGRLYVAGLIIGGGSLKVGEARPVPAPVTGITAVAWSGQDRLVVAGRSGGKSKLIEVSVDGGRHRDEEEDLGGKVVHHLVAYPEKPDTSIDDRRVMYQADDGSSYELFSGPEEFTAKSVVGVDPTSANLAVRPTAPFFLE